VAWSARTYLYFECEGDFGEPPYSSGQLDQMAFDPDRVTELVGLTPTSSWRRGDPRPVPKFPTARRFACWRYELPVEHTYYAEDVVLSLLNTIEPYADQISYTCQTLGLRAGIMLVIEMTGYRDDEGGVIVSTAVIGYSADTLHRLARINLILQHDQYVEIA
jgi:hypothetical protein